MYLSLFVGKGMGTSHVMKTFFAGIQQKIKRMVVLPCALYPLEGNLTYTDLHSCELIVKLI